MHLTKIQNYIGGEFRDPTSSEWADNINPATGKVIGQVPISSGKDVSAAVNAAAEAFSDWSQTSITERSQWLRRLAAEIAAHQDDFAKWETEDSGKPLKLAQSVDIPRSIQNLEFFADAISQWPSESHHGAAGLNYTLRSPRGVVACISPWNLPLYLFTWKIAPALAAGNTVVAKPSEVTPLTAFRLSEAASRIGFPKGVLNIIHGPGDPTGETLVNHPAVKTITFTGGTKTGQKIAAQTAGQLKKVSLELGGKNPNIIFADCSFEKMLSTTIRSSFSNQGQICLCGSRILIEESIYDRFKSAFVDATKRLKLGDPLDPTNDLGAVVSAAHHDKVINAIRKAEQEGGQILAGGKSMKLSEPNSQGFFIEPTIIEGIGPDCDTFQDEIFGPVVTLSPFQSEPEALALANASTYGLSATIWTEHLTKAHRLAAQLDVGIVWINTWLKRDLRTPFGGMNQSGLGREGGAEALRFFTEPKNICIDISE